MYADVEGPLDKSLGAHEFEGGYDLLTDIEESNESRLGLGYPLSAESLAELECESPLRVELSAARRSDRGFESLMGEELSTGSLVGSECDSTGGGELSGASGSAGGFG